MAAGMLECRLMGMEHRSGDGPREDDDGEEDGGAHLGKKGVLSFSVVRGIEVYLPFVLTNGVP